MAASEFKILHCLVIVSILLPHTEPSLLSQICLAL